MVKPGELLPLSAGELLTSRIGKRLTSFVRYLSDPKEEYAAEIGEPEHTTFAMSMGAISMGFDDGIVIALGTAISSNCVVLMQDGAGQRPALKDDPDAFPVDARDPIYSQKKYGNLIGLKLKKLSAFKSNTRYGRYYNTPDEIGLAFLFDDNSKIVFGHGYEKGLCLPGLIFYDEIEPSIREDYIEIPIAP